MKPVGSKTTDDRLISQARETGKVRGYFSAWAGRADAKRHWLTAEWSHADRRHKTAVNIHNQACQKLDGRGTKTKIRGYVAALRGIIEGSSTVIPHRRS